MNDASQPPSISISFFPLLYQDNGTVRNLNSYRAWQITLALKTLISNHEGAEIYGLEF